MRTTIGLVALVAALASAPSANASPQQLYIRTDLLGYPTGAPGTGAFVMSSRSLAGRTVTLRGAGGRLVRSINLAGRGRSWSRHFPDVYAVTLGPLPRGDFTLSLAGSRATGELVVREPQLLYGPALARALRFYQDERDGPQFIASALRSAPAHLSDEHASVYRTPKVNEEGQFAGELTPTGETIDAAGGWWDAGDYLKFVQTESYTADVMLSADGLFPSLAGGASAGFAAESEFGLRWLARMWNPATATLYYQVGIGAGNERTYSDHDVWRLPQEDETFGGEDPLYRFIRHRPVFRAGAPGSKISPNLAGRLSAAFAGGYLLLRRTQPALAQQYLADAEQIYALADTHPHGHLLTTIPWGFYPESEWRDDMLLGASVLARALSAAPAPGPLTIRDPGYYLRGGAAWLRAYSRHSNPGEPLNLYDTSALGEFELVRALRTAGQRGGAVEHAALAALGAKLAAARRRAARDPFGLGTTWANSDTTSRADGLSATASMYDALTRGHKWASAALEWIGSSLGSNAWGSSFIVGDGTLFPRCLQHQVANLIGSLNGRGPVLEGAVVEGPSNERSSGEVAGMRRCPTRTGDPFARFDGSGAHYEDNVQAYTNTEPAIDLTASSILAFAFLARAPVNLK